ncbi:hypothetical protein [Stutzerimonas nitrititolerans]|uniref:hypothetical protein n=1 Tax=Stutzerimonas nitrititolerans TaxID=2482751 RepID=UPI003F80B812
MSLVRKVQWQGQELPRDNLGTSTKNSLDSTLPLFEEPSNAAAEVLAALKGKPAPAVEDETEEVIADPLADIESQALELIKDRVNELDWNDMQQLHYDATDAETKRIVPLKRLYYERHEPNSHTAGTLSTHDSAIQIFHQGEPTWRKLIPWSPW